MRKLFAVGIVSVVILIAWFLFLNYDLKRFEKENTFDTQQQQVSEDGSNKAFIQNGNTHKSLENASPENAGMSIQSTDTLESITSKNTNKEKIDDVSNMVDNASEVVNIDLQQTSTNTGISPELMKLFASYRPLDEELEKVISELSPLREQRMKSSNRRREIIKKLGEANIDKATVKTLNAELEKINDWNTKTTPIIMGLQSEVEQIQDKQLTLLKEHGFSSWEDFLNPHGETYFNWSSGKTN